MKPRRNEEAQAHIGLSSHRKKNVALRQFLSDYFSFFPGQCHSTNALVSFTRLSSPLPGSGPMSYGAESNCLG
jgi:hypothetical protein